MTFLVLVSAASVIPTVLALVRLRRDGPRALASPRGLLLAYVAVASAVPTVWVYTQGPLLVGSNTMADSTPLLMALGVLGFAVGALVPFPQRWGRGREERRQSGASPVDRAPRLKLLGRGALAVPLAVAAYGVATASVETRGANQTDQSIADSLTVAADILAVVAVLLLAAASRLPGLLSRWDVGLVALLVVLNAYNGNRGGSVIILLLLVLLWLFAAPTGRRTTWTIVIMGLLLPAAGVAASALVLQHRDNAISGGTAQQTIGPLEMVVRDWESVPYTVGETATAVAEDGYYRGQTIVVALVRQLPSFVTTPILGPVQNSGAFVFRDLVDAPEGQGFGFSLIAEGVLNFGAVGAVAIPLLFGAALSWLYSRADLGGGAYRLLYFIAAATVPMAWRSDLLGTTKFVLYAFVLLTLLLWAARHLDRLKWWGRGEPVSDRGTSARP